MQWVGDQITNSIDKQINYMIEKLGPVTSMRLSASKEPLQLPVNLAL